ncbi:MAG TPA: DUF4421 family protein [Bacteroidia bacterium]|jgi:hypothetical protein
MKIKDIPHKTFFEKWMWPHRSAALIITRERAVNYDTAYIHNYYKRVVITLPVSTRFLKFSLRDRKSGNKLTFSPNLQYNLGVSISSRWATFILNSAVKLYTGDTHIKGKTTYRDYQLQLYGRKINTDLFVQQYNGFFIRNSKSYNAYQNDQPYSIRSDVNALNIGASSVYVLNHRRYSYGNSFAFIEQQKKSAGSLLVGIYYTYFAASGDPSLINEPFRDSFDPVSRIRKGHAHNGGINIGYIYTLVLRKKYSATASITQGVGAEQAVYTRDDNSKYHQLAAGAGKLSGRVSLRYDNGRMFIGTTGMFDYFLFRGKVNSTFDYSFGKLMVFTGYRFSVLKREKNLLRKLKLSGY